MGQHAVFILAAYALTALVISSLVVRAILDHRAQQRRLSDLEARGMKRRSSRG